MSAMFDTENFYKTVGKNIKKYRTLRNLSLQVLGEKVDLTKKTVQRYEQGLHRIQEDRMKKLAEALDVSVSQLTEGALVYIGAEVEESENISLPIVGKISCGDGSLAYENIEGYELTPRSWLNGGEYFYLRAKGDSMTGARIHDGDLLLIRKQEEVEDGEIAAVMIGEEAVLKRVYRQGGILVLQSENPIYPPIICDKNLNENIQIFGRLRKIIVDL